MFTISQITAILGLLMAFGVDPSTIDNVNSILMGQSPPAVTIQVSTSTPPVTTFNNIPQQIPENPPVFGNIGCVENTELLLSATQTDEGDKLEAIYSTGCEITSDTPYSFTVTGGDTINSSSYRTGQGTIGHSFPSWADDGSSWNGKFYTKKMFFPYGNPYKTKENSPIVFTMTVGTATTSISI